VSGDSPSTYPEDEHLPAQALGAKVVRSADLMQFSALALIKIKPSEVVSTPCISPELKNGEQKKITEKS